MKTLLTACSFGLALGLIAGATGDAAPSLGHVRELIRSKQYEEAKGELAPAVERLEGAERDEALLLLAGLETKPERAIPLYERVIASGTERAALRAERELATIYYAQGEYRQALEVLSAAERKPGRREPVFRFLRGLCYRQLADNTSARTEFVKVDRGEYLSWSSLALAEIDMEEGKIAEAVERYEAIGGKFANPIASFNLGECYEILGQRDKSIDVYRAVVATFPRSLEAAQAKEKMLRMSQSREESRATKGSKGGEEGAPTGREGGTGTAHEGGYALQFGAFTERENAIRMAKQIETLIKDVRVESTESGNRTWHRVRTGRYANRETAERDATLVEQRLGFSATIVPLK